MSVVISAAVFIAAMIACMIAGVDTFFALLLGIALFSVIGLKRGHKMAALWRMMWSEGRKLVPLLLIFVFIGAITALWRSSGTITFFIYYGIQIIRPGIFILVAFLLTCLLSYALGTSFGVTGTVGIILMALARSGGVDTAITAGAVLSGAYFGDRCSPASSSGLLVAAVTETKQYDNIRNMHRTGWLPMLVSIAIYAALSAANPIQSVEDSLLNTLTESFSLSLWTVVPALLMLVLPMVKVSISTTLIVSCAAAFAVSVLVQGMPAWDTLYAAVMGYTPQSAELTAILSGGGVLNMMGTSFAVMATGLFAGLLSGLGVLDGLKGVVEKLAVKWGLFPATVLVSLVAGMIFCNQSIIIMMAYPLLRHVYERRGHGNEELALDVENSGIVMAALIPWNIAGSVPLQMLDAGPSAIPYMVLLYMIPLCHGLSKKWLTKNMFSRKGEVT
ncbi:MAG: sodium:proton antiporter [Ruminococcaceae bacterium]|nr:sodium:proton antiporter [Oscillospiraceae bacterium]